MRESGSLESVVCTDNPRVKPSAGYSVIIPTMWKAPGFSHFLIKLCDYEAVEEVVLIDNRKEAAPKIDHPKLVWLKQAGNIYVNPAWNLGVRTARCSKLCIANDDIEFDSSLFEIVDPMLERAGIIGLDFDRAEGDKILIPTQSRPNGFRCLMFLSKDHYCPIPEVLKVWCGDDYLFRVNQLKGRKNYKIRGGGHAAQSVSVTASTIPNKILLLDKRLYRMLQLLLALRHPFKMVDVLRSNARERREWMTQVRLQQEVAASKVAEQPLAAHGEGPYMG